MKMRNFTTTLPESMIYWLEEMAQTTHQSKKSILLGALESLKKDYEQYQVQKSYAQLSNDEEAQFFTNAGMKDWNKLIETWEKK